MRRVIFQETSFYRDDLNRRAQWPCLPSLTIAVRRRLGENARLVTIPGQRVVAEVEGEQYLLPEWVQTMTTKDRNLIW